MAAQKAADRRRPLCAKKPLAAHEKFCHNEKKAAGTFCLQRNRQKGWQTQMQQRILVLGGAGYIGSHTVYALIDSGAEVVVIDNLETGFAAAVHPQATFYHGDIRDAAFLDTVFAKERLDGVIHFAANSQVGESMTDPLKYYDNNLCGTKTLLEAMVRHGLDNIVFSSTAAVYGTPEQSPILETDRTAPINCYGETKLAMENMFRWTGVAHGLRFVSLRYFNACGAHESGQIGEAHNPETHLLPLVLQVPLGQRPHISIYGTDYPTRDGTCVRDYIHVTDLAEAHILALRYLLDGGASEIFNLGNGIGFTVREVIAAAEQALARPIAIAETDRRAGDPAALVASSEKAKRILGWNPTRADLPAIVASAWRWHESHPNGFEQA
jgi:UDP-glucose-4-epimerase